MKFRELLPTKLISDTTGAGVSHLLGLSPIEAEQVQYHYDRMVDEWDGLLNQVYVLRTRFNFIAHCFFYLEASEQEYTPQQIVAMTLLIAINGVQLEEMGYGKQKTAEAIPDLLTPLSDLRMECGAHYGMMTHRMYNVALAQKRIGGDMGLGRRVNDDTLIRLMSRQANNDVSIGPLTQSDLMKIVYSMGMINTTLTYTAQNNFAVLPIPSN